MHPLKFPSGFEPLCYSVLPEPFQSLTLTRPCDSVLPFLPYLVPLPLPPYVDMKDLGLCS